MARRAEPGLFGKDTLVAGTRHAQTAEDLARIFGLAPTPAGQEALGVEARLGQATAERLGGPSVFDQLGIADRAGELTRGVTAPTLAQTGFGGRTESENALLQEIMGLTGAGTAGRGLGAPTQGALGSQLAPALMQLRQQDIENRNLDFQNILKTGQLGVQQLGGLTQAAGIGGQERLGGIQGLLDLAGLSMATPIAREGSGGGSIGSTLGGIGGFAMGAAKLAPLLGFCHVAEELFGMDDIRTHFARFYCAVNDNQFIRTYRKMSKIWAKHLRDNPDKKHIVKPIWESMAVEGYKEYKRWEDGLHQ